MKEISTSKYIISIIILIVIVLFFMSTTLFVYKFANTELSDKIADWGNFGNYIGFPMTMLTIVLLLLTFLEQRRTNNLSLFESAFWKLYDCVKLNNVDSVFMFITKHFAHKELSKKVSKSEYALLLQYYWGISTLNIDTNISSLFIIINYVVTDNRINNQDKRKFLDVIYSQLSEREYFCLLCYILWLSYNRQYQLLVSDPMLFSYHKIYDEKLRALVDILKSNQTLEILDCLYDDKDKYGDNEDRCDESYLNTLKRISPNNHTIS